MPSRHAHDYGPWSDWYYTGNGKDQRHRDCRDAQCGDESYETRRHVHGSTYPDFVKGKRVNRCMACDQAI